MKKIVAILLSLSMIFSSVNISFADENKDKVIEEKYPILEKFLSSLNTVENINKDTIKRLIVELKEDASLEEVKNKVKSIEGTEIKFEYDTIFTGFSLNIPSSKIAQLYEIEGIKNIEESSILEPQIFSAKEMTGIEIAKEKYSNKYNLDGRGLVIATIDSGVDLYSKDLKLDEDDPDVMEKRKIKEVGTHGPFTNKVPYGYNYFKASGELMDDVPRPHGMHIAGILAGNSGTADGFKGIAPNAQLLVYKVFTDNRKAGEEDIGPSDIEYVGEDAAYHAMDDAVKRGADIISLSIGERGRGDEDDIWHNAVKNAYDAGVVVVAAMGNFASSNGSTSNEAFADASFKLNDKNTAVSVAANPLVIGVGSTYNLALNVASVNIDGVDYPYTDLSRFNKDNLPEEELSKELIFVGRGMENDLKLHPEYNDVKDKIVLASRGGESVKDKVQRFLNKGAAGVIMLNDAISFSRGNYKTHPAISFDHLTINEGWAVSVSGDAGEVLKKKVGNGLVKIKFSKEKNEVKLREKTGISGFSSWGTNSNLDIKPDIVAPGEDIYSLANNGSYAILSGTSMASPHIAGMSALLIQRINEINLDLFTQNEIKKVDLSKILLMNTAKVLKDTEYYEYDGVDIEYSPRRQGAGFANLERALTTNVAVVYENKAAASLKEIGDKKDFTLKLINFSDKTQRFDIETSDVLSETTVKRTRGSEDGDVELNTLHERVVEGASLKIDKEVVIPANSVVEINASLDTGSAEDEFVEGYIYFKSKDENQVDINIPYMGFKGDWGKEEVFDKPAWEDASITKLTSLFNRIGHDHEDEKYIELTKVNDNDKLKPDKFSMTTTSRASTKVNSLYPRISFLRDAKKFELAVVKEMSSEAKPLRIIATQYNKTKYMENPFKESERYYNSFFTPDPTFAFNGEIYNPKTSRMEKVEEGQYYFRARAKVSDEKDYKEMYIPFKVDNTAPEMNVELNKESNKAIVKVSDNIGVWTVGATLDRKDLEVVKIDDNTYEVRDLYINALTTSTLRIEAMDYAGNPANSFEEALNKGNLSFNNLEEVKNKNTNKLNMSLKDASNTLKITYNGTPLEVTKEQDIFSVVLNNILDKDNILEFEVLDSLGERVEINRIKFNGISGNSLGLATGDEDLGESDTSVYDGNRNIDIKNGIILNHHNVQGNGYTSRDDVVIDYDNDDNIRSVKYKVSIFLREGQSAKVKSVNTHYNKINNKESYEPSYEESFQTEEEEEWIEIEDIPLYDGDNHINIKIFDNSGGEEKLIFNHGYMIYMDIQDPTFVLNSDNLVYIDGASVQDNDTIAYLHTNSDKAVLSGKVKDDLDNWELSINGNKIESGGLYGHFGLNEKDFKYEFDAEDEDKVLVEITDISENKVSFYLEVVVDKEAPTIDVVPTEAELTEDSILDINIEDNKGKENLIIKENINGRKYIDGTPLKDYEIKGREGIYLVEIIAKDRAGNETVKKLQIGEIEDIPVPTLKKTKLKKDELNNIEANLNISKNIEIDTLSIKKLDSKNVEYVLRFVDEFGRSIVKTYVVEVDEDDKDTSLSIDFKKTHFLASELNSIDDLIDVSDNIGVVLLDKIDASSVGEKKVRLRLYKDSKSNEVENTIYILPELEASLKKSNVTREELKDLSEILNLGDGISASLIEEVNALGEKELKVLLKDNYGHSKEVMFNVNVIASDKENNISQKDSGRTSKNSDRVSSRVIRSTRSYDTSKYKYINKDLVPINTIEGTWIFDKSISKWKFKDKNSKLYKNEWALIYLPNVDRTKAKPYAWFRFDNDANMQTSWFTDDKNNTYYLNETKGSLEGAMKEGWVNISDKWYYFNTVDGPYLGKMLKDTVTPDGYKVDSNGVYIK